MNINKTLQSKARQIKAIQKISKVENDLRKRTNDDPYREPSKEEEQEVLDALSSLSFEEILGVALYLDNKMSK